MGAKIYVTKHGETVDLACWRVYGRTGQATELVLDANRGSAALGPVLPMGTRLAMPDASPRAAPALTRLYE